MSADGQKALSAANLSRSDAEKWQAEIGERQPALVWARERGKIVKEK